MPEHPDMDFHLADPMQLPAHSPSAPANVRTAMLASFAGEKGDAPLTDGLLVQRFDAQSELGFDGEFQVFRTI
jgi:hypothetical protein